MLKWIFFDFDEVIGVQGDWYTPLVSALVQNSDIAKGVDIIDKSSKPWFIDQINDDPIIKEFTKLTGQRITKTMFKESVSASVIVSPKMVEVIKILKTKYKVGLITDNPRSRIDAIQKHPKMKNIFNYVTGSGYTGKKKSDMTIFTDTCKAVKTNPAECLMIDDRQEPNCNNALKAGMKTICFKYTKESDANELLRILRELKII